MRRFVFDGDVVSVSEQNAVLIGVVRREAIETIELRWLDGFSSVRVQLMHQNGYVYRSLGDLHFSFKVRTGSVIFGSLLNFRNDSWWLLWLSASGRILRCF